jgi:hypothetical protein
MKPCGKLNQSSKLICTPCQQFFNVFYGFKKDWIFERLFTIADYLNSRSETDCILLEHEKLNTSENK